MFFFVLFFIILTILHIFSTLWAENAPTYSWWQLDMNFVPYDLPKNISSKTTRGGWGEVGHPGSWTIGIITHCDTIAGPLQLWQC